MIMLKRIIPYICVKEETREELVQIAKEYENNGADEIYLSKFLSDEAIQEEFLMTLKAVMKAIDIPVTVGVHINRFEDVKKAFYTGAKAVVIKYLKLGNQAILKEAIQRFGAEQIIVEISEEVFSGAQNLLIESGVTNIICNHLNENQFEFAKNQGISIYPMISKVSNEVLREQLIKPCVPAVMIEAMTASFLLSYKRELKEQGIEVNTFETKVAFKEFKLDSNGLIPVIVQDYRTNEVLMMAYMNEESYQKTLQTGTMTYYSRSRQKLWVKGETSGHYQYVKELKLDCDQDTILAKVRQEGVACHTGNASCFYTELMRREYDDTNPYSVFEEVYKTILDRKAHPKEGSYTNYLFDKGIDKILKKCGEEATEIIIAAKNPEVEELKYEISDFLYHCMVLMAQRGVDWDDITKELAHRR